MLSENYEFFISAELAPFIGEWIAICDKKIVSHGSSAKEVFCEAKKRYPNKKPLLTKVPEKDTMIF